jgi:hypothetical protein
MAPCVPTSPFFSAHVLDPTFHDFAKRETRD